MEHYKIILFYKFTRIENLEQFRDEHRTIAQGFNLKGRMLIATEGVNATFEGKTEDIKAYQEKLRGLGLFKDVVFKESEGTSQAFSKLIVHVRPEVVTLGAGDFDIQQDTAPEVTAEQLETMFAQDEDFVVLDLRNDYEVVAGHFEKTVNPKLQNFRDLPRKLPELAHLKNKKVIAVCTGGIRCEKATCLLKREGFENIYQLKDGIHTYMQQYPGRHFKGSLFVFDNRMTAPIVDSVDRQVVARCAYCNRACEDYYSDDSFRPSRKIICCTACSRQHRELRSCVINEKI